MTRKRTDDNQTSIVKALRDAGASVQSLASIGRGCPDLLVGYAGKTHLIEVKARTGKLTVQESDWALWWNGAEVRIVRSVEQALEVIGIEAGK